MSEAYVHGIDRAPPFARVTTLLGYHHRCEIRYLELVIGETRLAGFTRGEHSSSTAGRAGCPVTTAAHPVGIIGRGQAFRLLTELFEDYPDYRIEHTAHRGLEHRPVRCVLTDDIGTWSRPQTNDSSHEQIAAMPSR